MKQYMMSTLLDKGEHFEAYWDDSDQMTLAFFQNQERREILVDYYYDYYQGNGYEEFGEMTDFTESAMALFDGKQKTEFQTKLKEDIKVYTKRAIQEEWEYHIIDVIDDIYQSRLESKT